MTTGCTDNQSGCNEARHPESMWDEIKPIVDGGCFLIPESNEEAGHDRH